MHNDNLMCIDTKVSVSVDFFFARSFEVSALLPPKKWPISVCACPLCILQYMQTETVIPKINYIKIYLLGFVWMWPKIVLSTHSLHSYICVFSFKLIQRIEIGMQTKDKCL